jgi:hypothetical protein
MGIEYIKLTSDVGVVRINNAPDYMKNTVFGAICRLYESRIYKKIVF